MGVKFPAYDAGPLKTGNAQRLVCRSELPEADRDRIADRDQGGGRDDDAIGSPEVAGITKDTGDTHGANVGGGVRAWGGVGENGVGLGEMPDAQIIR